MSTGAVVKVSNLTKVYGSLRAVDDISMTIEAGSLVGLIGPNGAGKSTTLSVVAGLLKPTSGGVTVDDIDPTRNPRTVKAMLGYMPDVLGHYDDLTVDEYLRFFAGTYAIPRKMVEGLIDDLLELVDLTVKKSSIVNDLSRGMKQRLSLARALVHDPKVLILDEPASGLDPRARIELRELLVQLNGMGKTIVVSSHILSELQEMCTEIGIVEAGRLLAYGKPDEIDAAFGRARTVTIGFLDGSNEKFAVADQDEQAALLRRLIVEDGRDVVSCSMDQSGLEEIFLKVTEGIVQ